MTENELNEIEVWANAATPGPWKTGLYGSVTANNGFKILNTNYSSYNSHEENCPNAKFIVCARENILPLVAEVRQLRAERDVLIHYIINQHDDCPRCMGEDYCQKPDTRNYCDGGFYKDLDEECYEESFNCWLEWARHEVEKAKETDESEA